MILTMPLPQSFVDWNRRYKAPLGSFWWVHLRPRFLKNYLWKIRMQLPKPMMAAIGPFGFQGNSLTRTVEYPWCYFATELTPGMKVIEIGGGASGFQFCLSNLGLNVLSIDPLENPSDEVDWRFTNSGFERLNTTFGGKITFVRKNIENAALPADAFDRIFAISVLEHVPQTQLSTLIQEVCRVLKPGGSLIATIDLFLDLAPFTNVESNIYGRNVCVKSLIENSGLRLAKGDTTELYGYEDFSPKSIVSRVNMGEIYVHNRVISQGIVLEKQR